jgi:hypothetical protein
MRPSVTALLVLGACGPEPINTDYPDHILPRPSLAVTEGTSTAFLLGLEGGPYPGAAGAFFLGPDICPTDATIVFFPCNFRLSSPTNYPVKVKVIARSDPDGLDEDVDTTAYLFGEISEANARLVVHVVDVDAVHVAADPWYVLFANGAATFGVRLTQPPTASFTVDVKPQLMGSQLQLAPSTLSFDASNFDALQPITVSGFVDLRLKAEQIALVPSDGGPTEFVYVEGHFSTP